MIPKRYALYTHYTKPPTSTALRVGLVGGFVPLGPSAGRTSRALRVPLTRPSHAYAWRGGIPRTPCLPGKEELDHEC